MPLADNMLRLLISNRHYHNTDINRAAYSGTTTEITYQKEHVVVNIRSFSLSSDGQTKELLSLTESAFKKWVEEQSDLERRKFASWVNQA